MKNKYEIKYCYYAKKYTLTTTLNLFGNNSSLSVNIGYTDQSGFVIYFETKEEAYSEMLIINRMLNE